MFTRLGEAWQRFWGHMQTPNPGIEPLEQRVLLSADLLGERLAVEGFEQILWQGEQVWAAPGQWIVQLEGFPGNATAEAKLEQLNDKLGDILPDASIIRHLGSEGLFLMQAPADLNHGQLTAALNRMPGFRFAEPDFAVWVNTETVLPNDPLYGNLWAMPKIQAPEAWSISTGDANVVVAVIDTGVDYNHPDLAGNMWVGPNGEHGWNFVNNTSNPMDDNGHGTHVAGTIGAVGNNGRGVVGVNWNVQIMAVKFLNAGGSGTTSAAIQSINYVNDMKEDGENIILSNNSWGGGGYSQAMENAIRRHDDLGMLFVAAAGNSGRNNDVFASYPASYAHPSHGLQNVIAVAASDQNDRYPNWSNFGSNSVHLAAPGVSIVSTYLNGGYASASGTSMAAPHVSGVAALALAANSDLGHMEIKQAILDGVDPMSKQGNRDTITSGRLNAFKTLSLIAPTEPPVITEPAAPSGLAATAASSSTVALAWSDNSDNEEGFRIERSQNAEDWEVIHTTAANVTSYEDSGLTAETIYHYRVVAFNSAGEAASDSVSVQTLAAPVEPDAPTDLSATAASSSQIDLSWSAGSDNEDGFVIESSADGGNSWTEVGTTGAGVTAFQHTGLAADTTYYYRVAAVNSAGTSEWSEVAFATTEPAPAVTAPAPVTKAWTTVQGRHHIRIHWEYDSPNPDGFEIRIGSAENGNEEDAIVVDGSTRTVQINHGVNGEYFIAAFNYGANGEKNYSEPWFGPLSSTSTRSVVAGPGLFSEKPIGASLAPGQNRLAELEELVLR